MCLCVFIQFYLMFLANKKNKYVVNKANKLLSVQLEHNFVWDFYAFVFFWFCFWNVIND